VPSINTKPINGDQLDIATLDAFCSRVTSKIWLTAGKVNKAEKARMILVKPRRSG
jgi:hypothetical protein